MNSISSAFVLAWPAVQFGLLPNKANIDAVVPLVKLWRWVLHAYLGCGEHFVSKRLKSLSNLCRWHAGTSQCGEHPIIVGNCPWIINGVFEPSWIFTGSISRKASNKKALLRFSRASRAYPAGDPKAALESLVNHHSEVTKVISCPDVILRRVSQVVSKITEKCLDNIDGPGVTLSNSASVENSRRQGGSAAHIRSILWKYQPEVACCDPADIHSDFESDEILGPEELYFKWIDGEPAEVRRVLKFTHLAMARCEFGTMSGTTLPQLAARKIPDHKVVAVPDRGGFKVRVITSAPACLQGLAHVVRKELYRKVLVKTPTMWGIRENGVPNFLRQLEIPERREKSLGPWVALSSDLTAATDRFPHDIVERINDAMEGNMPSHCKTSANWVSWRSLSGPQTLYYPESMNLDRNPISTSCGNMMGTAPSWFHLNLVNLSVFRCAWSIWTNTRTRKALLALDGGEKLLRVLPTSEVKTESFVQGALKILDDDRLNVFTLPRYVKLNKLTCIVGDDLCAACPYAVAVLYEIFIESCNGKLSAGKHYLQPWIDNAFILVAEDFGIVKGDKLELIGAEHLRGIISPVDYAQTRMDRREQPWANIGSRLSTSLSHCRPRLYLPLCSIAHQVTASIRSILLKRGLPVYLPTIVGGLGWPHPKGLRYAVDRISLNTLRAYSDLRGFRTDVLRFSIEIARLRSCWMSSAIASDYSELTLICRSALSSWKVSHDDKGVLAPLTRDARIGLRPSDESLPCISLQKVIDQFCMQGVVVRYLTDLGQLDHGSIEGTYRSVTRAAALYSRACNRLAQERRRNRPPVPRSDYVDFIESDTALLNSLFILIDGELKGMLRNLDQGFDVHPMDEGIPYSTVQAE